MPSPPRRRVDLTGLPAPARYALALAVVAVVVALAVTVPGHYPAGKAAGWYPIVVRCGAVLLLAYGGFRLGRRLLRARRHK
jgi:hypothetical protein